MTKHPEDDKSTRGDGPTTGSQKRDEEGVDKLYRVPNRARRPSFSTIDMFDSRRAPSKDESAAESLASASTAAKKRRSRPDVMTVDMFDKRRAPSRDDIAPEPLPEPLPEPAPKGSAPDKRRSQTDLGTIQNLFVSEPQPPVPDEPEPVVRGAGSKADPNPPLTVTKPSPALPRRYTEDTIDAESDGSVGTVQTGRASDSGPTTDVEEVPPVHIGFGKGEEAIGQQIGNYRIQGVLGKGGMGVVYLASHTLIGQQVAVKVLLPQFSQNKQIISRFFNEAKAASTVRHAGVVQVFDFGFHRACAYLVMEHLDGELLKTRLNRLGRFPLEQGLRVARQIAQTLAAAHERGVIHRDLKPENVMLVADEEVMEGERVKILDFGLAKLVDRAEDSSVATRVGTILGTPRYMAPEQCSGAGDIDHRADVYSLGGVLYHLLCGQPPFAYRGEGELIAAHLYEQPTAPRELHPEIPEPVSAVILKAIEKNREDRFSSMNEFATELRDLEQQRLSAWRGTSGDAPELDSGELDALSDADLADSDDAESIEVVVDSSPSAPSPAPTPPSRSRSRSTARPPPLPAPREEEPPPPPKVSADEVVRLGDPPDAEPSRKRSLLIAVGVAVLVLVGGALLLLSM